jgi:hypothetical protein
MIASPINLLLFGALVGALLVMGVALASGARLR